LLTVNDINKLIPQLLGGRVEEGGVLGVGNQGRLAALLAGQVGDEESLERLKLVLDVLGDGVEFDGALRGGQADVVAVLALELVDRLEVDQIPQEVQGHVVGRRKRGRCCDRDCGCGRGSGRWRGWSRSDGLRGGICLSVWLRHCV